jgi:hypothetical protein
MKEPGLDNRHRDKTGKIQQKRSDTLNKNLSHPIPQFSPNTTLGKMREKTGKVSESAVRRWPQSPSSVRAGLELIEGSKRSSLSTN